MRENDQTSSPSELAIKQEILFLLPEDQIEEGGGRKGGKRNTLLEKIFITRNLQDIYA